MRGFLTKLAWIMAAFLFVCGILLLDDWALGDVPSAQEQQEQMEQDALRDLAIENEKHERILEWQIQREQERWSVMEQRYNEILDDAGR